MIMKKIKDIAKGFLALSLLAIAFSGCENYNEEVIDSLIVSREFSPIGLTAKIRNQTSVELNWTIKDGDAENYVIEVSEDPQFKTIYKTVEVAAEQLPVQVQLESETAYAIRVKAVSSTTGTGDSKWSVVTATTLSEQSFLPSIDGDIEAKQITLRWIPNIDVTQIVVNPGAITHTITSAEKAAGIAVVGGLTGETDYTADLMNGTKKRGNKAFTTAIDIGTGILVKETDDLVAKINDAAAGAILVLEAGDYKIASSEIILNKSITLRGLRSYDKPVIYAKFTVKAGTVNLSLIDLNLDGTGITDAHAVTLADANTTYNDVLISGCIIHDYDRALLYASVSGSKLSSFTIDNSIVKKVNNTVQADLIDFRNTYVANIVVKNSTFDTCSAFRDFVRVDAASGFSGTGLTTNVLIDHCTLYKVSTNVTPRRILYIRFNGNASTVKNTLITETSALYSNQSATFAPTFSENYYYNAASFMDATISGNKIDASGTVANPQFMDAATGNFKVGNQTLIDNNIGDPRWIN
jgi:hypothetical protein